MQKLFIGVLLVMLLSACARTTVVLVPDDDGKVGAVRVSAGDASVKDLDSANAFTTVTGTVGRPGVMSEAEIEREFGRSLSALPQPPASFFFYFAIDSAVPDTASLTQLDAVVKAIREHPLPNVTIIGHTDRVGEPAFNNHRLSMSRASRIEQMLVAHGIDPAVMAVSWYGASVPIVPTAPGVAEPKNRRVEVYIR